MRKVVTVTLNPAIDLTIGLERLVPGTVHRSRSVLRALGGKGINIAACLADAGLPATVTGILGATDALEFSAFFEHKRIIDKFVRIDGNVRTNLKLLDELQTTDINLPGPQVGPGALRRVESVLSNIVESGTIVILSGSIPSDCPDTWYADICARLTASGATIILDTSDRALQAALDAPLLPFCIKPNHQELAEWAGHPLPDLPAIAEQACRLQALGVTLVVVSLGSNGALFAKSDEVIHAKLATTPSHTTVGAGDAMVAGITFGLAQNLELDRIARISTAFAVGKLEMRGANLPVTERIAFLESKVEIRAVDAVGAAT